MARRRSTGAKLASGLGEGLAQSGQFLLQRQAYKEQTKDRSNLQRLQALMQMLPGVMEGGTDPAQLMAAFPDLLEGMDLEGLRPSVGRRLSGTREAIESATSPESVPSIEDIFGQAAEADVPNIAGLQDFAQRGGVSLESLTGEARPEVQSLASQAGVRRRALEEAPNTIVQRPQPDGSTVSQGVSRRQLAEGVQTGLGAQDTGRLAGETARASREFGVTPEEEGTDAATRMLSELSTFTPQMRGEAAGAQENAATRVAGPGRAQQAGREQAARANAELMVQFSPQAINARLAEALAKGQAEMGLKEQAEFRKGFMQSQQAAAEFIPDFNELVATSEIVNNVEDLATARRRGLALRGATNAFGAQVLTGRLPGQVRQEEVEALTAMEQAKDRLLRRTVRAMGITEARVSDFEQELAARALAVDPGLTVTENRRALQNMRALTLAMPLVMQELGALDPGAPTSQIGQYATRAMEVAEELNRIEAEARDAGALYFQAPASFGSVLLRVVP